MQPRSLMILSALVLALGAFIFFYERELPSTDERTKLEKKVFTLEKKDVSRVEISWGEQRVRLEKREEKDIKDSKDSKDEKAEETDSVAAEWQLAEPFSARADSSLVDGLLGSLTELEKQRTIEGAERSAVGLDDPRARVKITTPKGEHLLMVGTTVPNAHAMIVGVEGRDDVYQVAEGLFDQLTKPPAEWRDKKLFTAARGDVEHVVLEGPAGRIALARRGESFWLESPISDLAERAAVDNLLNQITALRAESFVEAGQLGAATGTIEVAVAGREQPWKLALGATETTGKVLAEVAGELVTIAQELPEQLDKSPDAWRSRNWTGFQVYQVDTVTIEDPAGKLTLGRDGADWKRGEERIAYTTATDFLYALAEAKAEEITTREQALAAGFALGTPRLTLGLAPKSAEPEQLMLFERVGERTAATASGREAVLLLGASAVAEVESKLAALRSAAPLPPADATGTETDAKTDAETDAGSVTPN